MAAVEGLVGDQAAEGNSVDQRRRRRYRNGGRAAGRSGQIAERVGQRDVWSSCRPWSGRSPGSASPFCALTVAMDFDDGGIDHGVFHIRLVAGLEHQDDEHHRRGSASVRCEE